MMNYKLSPSDLTFLYDGCRRCFVLKVKHGIAQPSIPLPGIFSTISYLQKEHYSEKRTEEICPGLPSGVIRYGERWVRSRPVELPGCSSTCYINGRFDVVAELDDGSYAVIDFKTGNPADEKSTMYSRQLHAYALALENPDESGLGLAPVSTLVLLYFTPDHCEQTGPARQILGGRLEWIEVRRDDEAFHSFLRDVLNLLDGPLPSGNPDECDWCKYIELMSSLSTDQLVSSDQREQTLQTPSCPLCGGGMRFRTGRFGDFWSCLKYPECKGTHNP
jgi:hypothetical protein